MVGEDTRLPEATLRPRQVAGALTVERFYDETWLPLRTRPWAWKTDAGVMKRHFLPHFGARAIADLGTDDGEVALLDWVITRLEMQWPGMCEAVLAIDSDAWNRAQDGAAGDEVTVEVTARVTLEATTKEKPPMSLGKSGVTWSGKRDLNQA